MENMQKELAELTALAETLKAMAHPVRLCILKGLKDSGSCNVNKIQDCLGMPQSTVSQHLAKLRTAGLVKARRQGVEVFYDVADERVLKMLKFLFEN